MSSPDRAHTPRYTTTLLGVWALLGQIKRLIPLNCGHILFYNDKELDTIKNIKAITYEFLEQILDFKIKLETGK